MLTALTIAADGNVTGGIGQFAQNATIAYLQELGTSAVKQIADSLSSDEVRAALHAIVGCTGAAASNQSCGAGAMGAAVSSVLNTLLGPADNLTTEERNGRTDIISALVASIAGAGGLDAATASGAAQIETVNNGASGTPGNNHAQNKQFRDVVVALRLTPPQAKLLHIEISKKNMGFHEIMQEAKDMFGK